MKGSSLFLRLPVSVNLPGAAGCITFVVVAVCNSFIFVPVIH
jgi:hypothetical protein